MITLSLPDYTVPQPENNNLHSNLRRNHKSQMNNALFEWSGYAFLSKTWIQTYSQPDNLVSWRYISFEILVKSPLSTGTTDRIWLALWNGRTKFYIRSLYRNPYIPTPRFVGGVNLQVKLTARGIPFTCSRSILNFNGLCLWFACYVPPVVARSASKQVALLPHTAAKGSTLHPHGNTVHNTTLQLSHQT
jgi:hypothetical protein